MDTRDGTGEEGMIPGSRIRTSKILEPHMLPETKTGSIHMWGCSLCGA